MADYTLERNTGSFLYEQIARLFINKIHNGELHDGEKIPSENELCILFNTSRPTVRRAIKELEVHGFVKVKHGIGTFVAIPKVKDMRILDFSGYTDDMSQENTKRRKIILEKRIRIANPVECQIFEHAERFKLLELVRGVYEDSTPMSVDYAYFPLYLYPGIQEKIFEDTSTYRLIRQDYGVVFKKVYKSIEFTDERISPKGAAFLMQGELSPLVSVKKKIEDDEQRIIHFSNFFLLPNAVKFSIELDIES